MWINKWPVYLIAVKFVRYVSGEQTALTIEYINVYSNITYKQSHCTNSKCHYITPVPIHQKQELHQTTVNTMSTKNLSHTSIVIKSPIVITQSIHDAYIVCVCVCACMRVCVRACVRACVCVCDHPGVQTRQTLCTLNKLNIENVMLIW